MFGGGIGDGLLLWGRGSREGYLFRHPNVWQSIPDAPPGDVTFNGFGAKAGDHFLVWNASEGAAYDFASDTWRSMTPMGDIEPRPPHHAPWLTPAGKDYVAHLGVRHSNGMFVLDGRLYDVARDRWEPFPVDGAPTAVQPTAVWAGAHLIVWGGLMGSEATDEGATLDTSTMTWSPMSSANAPAPRGAAAVVWTGSRMFVWGDDLRSGGLYDLARDAWSAADVRGAPEGDPHLAVWTGHEIIVLGRDLNSYGIYHPTRDRWRPMASPPRSAIWEIAAWDGCRVLAYGSGRMYTYQPPPAE